MSQKGGRRLPYRDIAEMIPDPPPALTNKLGRVDIFMVVALIFWGSIMLFVIGCAIRDCGKPPPPPKPCSAYQDRPLEVIPARCFKNFDGEK